MPMPVLVTSTMPKSASWIGPIVRMTASSPPRIALNRVKTLARTIAQIDRLVPPGARLTKPRSTRSATSTSVNPRGSGVVSTSACCTWSSRTAGYRRAAGASPPCGRGEPPCAERCTGGMRSRVKSWAAAGVGVAMLVGVVVALAAPAAAKGVASLTVTGPGIPVDAPIEVSGRTHPGEWDDILASSGFYEALPDLGSSGLAARAESEYLGPRHTLTWHVMTGPGEMTPVRQALADACVPIIGDFEASTVCWERRWAAKAESARGTGRAVAEPAAGDPWWPEAAAGLGAASAAGLAAAVALRRARLSRRRRMAPISL